MSLLQLMSASPIRDLVMSSLEPVAVVSFVIATGFKFTKTDMNIYTNIFKYFVADRQWLLKKMSQGYAFTALSPKLVSLVDRKSDFGGGYHSYSRYSSFNHIAIDVLLIVTKDKRVISCNNDFMPYDVFSSVSIEDAKHVNFGDLTRSRFIDNSNLESHPPLRTVIIGNHDRYFKVHLMLQESDNTVPLHLPSSVFHDCMFDRNGLGFHNEPRYCVASKAKTKISKRVVSCSGISVHEKVGVTDHSFTMLLLPAGGFYTIRPFGIKQQATQ